MTTFTAFGADKAAIDTVTAAELNTYLRDNLKALYEHQSNTSGQHGINAANHIAGADAPAMHIEGHRGAQTGGSDGDWDTTFTWTIAFSAAPYVVHSLEIITTGGTLESERLTAVSTTGCTLRAKSVNSDDRLFRAHVIALGVD